MRTALATTALTATVAAFATGAAPAAENVAPVPSAEAPIVVGIDAGGGPYLTEFDGGGSPHAGFLAYMDFTQGGIHIAAGDVDGDGRADLATVPGRGGRGEVRTFDGSGKPIGPDAFTTASGCGTRIALGDVNGDGKSDLVTGFEQCTPFVQVFDGVTGRRLANFGTMGTHGIRVASGDITGDGRAEVITGAGSGDPPIVKVFTGTPATDAPAPLRSFVAFGPAMTGGLEVATGDFDRDDKADVVVGTETPDDTQIKVFDGSSGVLRGSFSPFGLVLAGTLRIAAGDVAGDARPEIVAAATVGYQPIVRIFTAEGTRLAELGAPHYNGRSLAVGDMDGDGKGELAMGAGPGYDSAVTVFDLAGNTKTWFQSYGYSFTNGVRVASGDLDGNGTREYVTGQGPGGGSILLVLDAQGTELRRLQPFGDLWNGLYVASGDVDGDARADLVAGAGQWTEPRVKVFDGGGQERASFLAFDSAFQGGVRVATGDLDGDGRAEVVAGTGPGGPPVVRIFDAYGGGTRRVSFYAFDPSYTGGIYVAAGDLDADGRAEIVVGAGTTGEVRVFDPSGVQRASFIAYSPSPNHTDGVRVAVGDVDGDGRAEIVTGPGGVRPVDVRMFTGSGVPAGSFRAHPDFQGGIYVAVPAPLGPPLVSARAVPVRGTESRRVRLVAAFYDPRQSADSNEFSARVSWGDGDETAGIVQALGSGQYGINATHRYAQFGRYPVVVRIEDIRLRATSTTTTARVADAPITARGRVVRISGQRFRGVVATVRDTDPLGMSTDLRATVAWGDGTRSRAQVRGHAGRFEILGDHRYRKPGTYRAVVAVRSLGGSRASARSSIRVVS